MRFFILGLLAFFLYDTELTAQGCQIQIPRIEATSCDSSGTYQIFVLVEIANGSDSCFVFANGVNFGRQSYQGPIVPIGPFPGNGQSVLITVFDEADSTCLDSFLFEGLQCDTVENCQITSLIAEPTACDSLNMYYVDVMVEGIFTSDSFQVWANGISFGLFNYLDVPARIGPFPGGGQVVLYVEDQLDTICTLGYALETVNCDSTSQCNWERVIVETSDCDDFGNYFLDVEVNAQNPSDSFFVIVNGDLQGFYSYANQPIRLGAFPGDGQTDLNILLVDALDTLCTYFTRREALLCDSVTLCNIGNLLVESSPCDEDGRFSAKFTFDTNQEGDVDYEVFVNQRFIGRYKVGRLPQQITRLSRRASDYQLIKVCIADRPDCCVTHEFYLPCCQEEQNCNLTSPRYRIWCLESGEYFVLLDFDATLERADSFRISGNGNNYGRFAYNQRPVLLGPFEAGNRNREFVMQDGEFDSCFVVLSLENADCDNPTNVLEIESGVLKVMSTESFIMVEGIRDMHGKLRLHSLNGSVIAEQPWEWPLTTIYTEHLPKGIYILEAIFGSKSFAVKINTGK